MNKNPLNWLIILFVVNIFSDQKNAYCVDFDDQYFTSIYNLNGKSINEFDKYDKALLILSRDPSKFNPDLSSRDLPKYRRNTLKNAMEVSQIENFRLYPVTTWGIHLCNYIVTNYYRLINIELHHMAGDMLHIVRTEQDGNYDITIKFAKLDEFENNHGKYNCYHPENFKLSDENRKYFEKSQAVYVEYSDAFIKMLSFFKRWENLQKQTLEYTDLKKFYSDIKVEYEKEYAHAYDSYSQIGLLKFRKERKLSLSGHSPKEIDDLARKKSMAEHKKSMADCEKKFAQDALNYKTQLWIEEQRKSHQPLTQEENEKIYARNERLRQAKANYPHPLGDTLESQGAFNHLY